MNKKLIEAASLGVIIMGTISAITLVTVMLKKYKDEDDIKETTKNIEEKSHVGGNTVNQVYKYNCRYYNTDCDKVEKSIYHENRSLNSFLRGN